MAEGDDYSFQTGKIKTFTILDYVLFGFTLVVSAVIGIFYAIKDRNKNNTKDFLLAGGNMNPIPVSLSLLASFMSAITILGTPAEMYNYTFVYWWIGVGYIFVIAGAAHIFIPVFYRLRVTSVYEYLEKRFSKGVRTAGSVTFCIQMTLYMAIVLYAPSLALNAVTGFTLWGSVISVGLVCTFYTTLGGMKAVLWTDSFQIGMMYAGLIAVLVKGAESVGGMSQAWSYAEETGRTLLTDWSPDPATRHSVWALVIGGMFTWIAIYGVNQSQVQRACSCGSLRQAQIAMWINLPGLWGILYLGCLIGITMYAFYRHCDPIQFKLISASDQLLPLFVMDVMGNVYGIPGLFVACLFSGALSTISSGLNSIAACVLQDVVRAYFYKDMSEKRATNVSKIIAAVFGLICIGLTYVASLLGGVLQMNSGTGSIGQVPKILALGTGTGSTGQYNRFLLALQGLPITARCDVQDGDSKFVKAALSLFGMIGGPLLGIFTLGMIFPWANAYGAYAGLLGSLVFMFWIGIGTQIVKPAIPRSPLDLSQCNWNLTTTAASVTSLVNLRSTTASSMISTTMEFTHNATLAIHTATTSSSAVVEHGPLYKLYTLSYIWYSATAVLTAVVIGLIVSFLTGRTKASEMDPRLMAPLFDIIFPFLPEKILKPLRFGVRYDMIKHLKSDDNHTANELQTGEVEKYFNIEIAEKEQTTSDHKMRPDNEIWHIEKHKKHDDDTGDGCISDIGNNGIYGTNPGSSTQALIELKMYRRI